MTVLSMLLTILPSRLADHAAYIADVAVDALCVLHAFFAQGFFQFAAQALTFFCVTTLVPAYDADIAAGGEVVNWFDRPDEVMREGYYSILDTMESIKQSPAGAALLGKMMENVHKSYGDVAKSVTMPPSVQKMLDRQPLEKMLKQAGKAVTPAMVKQLNAALNQIPRVE